MEIRKPLTVADVAAMVPHTADWVRDAANSGALESLPRGGRRHMFTETHVADWINKGAPKFPDRLRRTA
ncbi:hypothetical protein CH274_13525 [Rhodococcus sp. 06-418-5]|uniref:helix-turn-helix domain-containing protein n=1 Tax=Rhodococcus sp. 06-418-5 TaxID=2022507 RepID=UPI000B9B0240|nr:hypothetical protein CH274_13525 [Rhodococcus sp. 06-418-5]